MSGRRPSTTRIWNFIGSFRDSARSGATWTTLPGQFKEHGYLTLGTGKVRLLLPVALLLLLVIADAPISWAALPPGPPGQRRRQPQLEQRQLHMLEAAGRRGGHLLQPRGAELQGLYTLHSAQPALVHRRRASERLGLAAAAGRRGDAGRRAGEADAGGGEPAGDAAGSEGSLLLLFT